MLNRSLAVLFLALAALLLPFQAQAQFGRMNKVIDEGMASVDGLRKATDSELEDIMGRNYRFKNDVAEVTIKNGEMTVVSEGVLRQKGVSGRKVRTVDTRIFHNPRITKNGHIQYRLKKAEICINGRGSCLKETSGLNTAQFLKIDGSKSVALIMQINGRGDRGSIPGLANTVYTGVDKYIIVAGWSR